MGWIDVESPEHEGYVVGLVEEKRQGGYTRFRELSYPDDGAERAGIRVFQAACECGWRSRRFAAPPNTRWFPFTLELDDDQVEEDARRLWHEHCAAERRALMNLTPWPSP